MDARADAALRMALGNSRDDVIAELQARNRQLEQRVAIFTELHLQNQWDDYMAMAAQILRRTNQPADITHNTNQFFYILPFELYRLICRAGYGLCENLTIKGRRHPAGRLSWARGDALCEHVAQQISISVQASVRELEQLTMRRMIRLVSEDLGIPGALCVV